MATDVPFPTTDIMVHNQAITRNLLASSRANMPLLIGAPDNIVPKTSPISGLMPTSTGFDSPHPQRCREQQSDSRGIAQMVRSTWSTSSSSWLGCQKAVNGVTQDIIKAPDDSYHETTAAGKGTCQGQTAKGLSGSLGRFAHEYIKMGRN